MVIIYVSSITVGEVKKEMSARIQVMEYNDIDAKIHGVTKPSRGSATLKVTVKSIERTG